MKKRLITLSVIIPLIYVASCLVVFCKTQCPDKDYYSLKKEKSQEIVITYVHEEQEEVGRFDRIRNQCRKWTKNISGNGRIVGNA